MRAGRRTVDQHAVESSSKCSSPKEVAMSVIGRRVIILLAVGLFLPVHLVQDLGGDPDDAQAEQHAQVGWEVGESFEYGNKQEPAYAHDEHQVALKIRYAFI